MTSFSRLLESTALLLSVAAAACGESATELAAKAARQRAASPNEEAPNLDGTVAPPAWTIQTRLGTSKQLIEHMPPGFVAPPGQFWGHDVKATGFPPGRSWSFQVLARFRDGGGILLEGAGGGGVVPADGVFHTSGAANCPSLFSEMWVVVSIAGLVPPC
jgi:hypothetical protein